jgi:hypothetical protein
MTVIMQRVAERAGNIGAMMHHLGVPEESACMGRQMNVAARRCLFCARSDECRRWLAAPEADPTAWQEFCPNAALFGRLRQ